MHGATLALFADMRAVCTLLLLFAGGCSYATIGPGHRGVLFNPGRGGLQREVLGPGRYKLPSDGRVEDFDVTYTTKMEDLEVRTQDGADVSMRVSLVYRPILSELYALENELGPDYYAEVVGPEFRSAARGVIARHPLADARKKNERVEDEIESELRRRTAGKHVEISSVLLELMKVSPVFEARALIPCAPSTP